MRTPSGDESAVAEGCSSVCAERGVPITQAKSPRERIHWIVVYFLLSRERFRFIVVRRIMTRGLSICLSIYSPLITELIGVDYREAEYRLRMKKERNSLGIEEREGRKKGDGNRIRKGFCSTPLELPLSISRVHGRRHRRYCHFFFRFSSSSTVRGQSFLSSRERPRSARSFPSVWQVA